MYFTHARFDLGFQIGLFAFTAAVLGGIGNLTGAALGALLIGLIQNFNKGLSWHAPGSDWTESIVFSILILILVFRPQGLLGEAARDDRRLRSSAPLANAPTPQSRRLPRGAVPALLRGLLAAPARAGLLPALPRRHCRSAVDAGR